MGPITEHQLMLFLVQFALLLGACKLVGLVFKKFKQPTITGDVLVGLILGPAIFGRYAPELQSAIFPNDAIQWSMLETVAWFGNLFLLMETGLEINFSRIWKQRGEAVKLSFSMLLIPIILSFIPSYFIPARYMIDPTQRTIFALFIASIMTISALPVAIRGMKDLGILQTDVGFLIISALTLNDIVGWMLFTVILGIFAHGSIEISFVLRLIVMTLTFTFISLTLFKKLVDKAITLIHIKLGSATGYKTTFIVIVGMIMGAITIKIGIHSLFGFFIAGIVVGEAQHITELDRHTIRRMVYSIFVPIFFAKIGLQIDILANLDYALVAAITILGIASRYIGAWVGAKLARQEKANLKTIAISTTPGGEMHIVIAMLAYSGNLISEKVFVSIVAASLLSTIIFGPWLTYTLSKLRKDMVNFLFTFEDVFYDSSARTKEELLRHLIGNIAPKLDFQESLLRTEIFAREEQTSTAVGRGVAFPHARLQGLTNSKLFVVRVAHGLDWDSPDGLSVELVFLTLYPTDQPESQLKLMQTITTVIRNPKILAKLLRGNDTQKIYHLLKSQIAENNNNLVQDADKYSD
ncbi:MAG: cation:proton antiporter [Candidatus Cloacimonetes bacterium]|nr:cation:proton antiporter [Candidatus Cloacimonadota bacterium]